MVRLFDCLFLLMVARVITSSLDDREGRLGEGDSDAQEESDEEEGVEGHGVGEALAKLLACGQGR